MKHAWILFGIILVSTVRAQETVSFQIRDERREVLLSSPYCTVQFQISDTRSCASQTAGLHELPKQYLATSSSDSGLFQSAMTLIEQRLPLAIRLNDIDAAAELFRQALRTNPARHLQDDILLAWGHLYYLYRFFLANDTLRSTAVIDSAIHFLRHFFADTLDYQFHPYLRNSSKLFLVNAPYERTDEAALATLFDIYVGGASSFALTLPYPYDSLKTVGMNFLSRFPNSPISSRMRALLFLHRIRQMSPEAVLSESRQVIAQLDPANALEVYRQLGEYMTNRGRYDLTDTLANEIADRFSRSDYYSESVIRGLGYSHFGPLDFPGVAVRWRDKTITISFSAGEGQAPITQTELENLRRALRAWKRPLDQFNVDFSISSTSDAMIQIALYDSGYVLFGNRRWAGWALISSDAQFISRAEIKLSRTWSTRIRQLTLVHELGHALGILGHSLNRDDIMYPLANLVTRSDADSVLSSRDSATIAMIYKAPRIETQLNVPAHVKNGNAHSFEILVSDPDGLRDIDSVMVDLTRIGGSRKQLMSPKGNGAYGLTFHIRADTVPYIIHKSIIFAIKDKFGLASWAVNPNFLILPSTPPTTVAQSGEMPFTFYLSNNYPNPFNSDTRIQFSIPARERVTLNIYDVLGREVAKLIDQHVEPGVHSVSWHGSRLSSGVYYIRLNAGGWLATKKAILLK